MKRISKIVVCACAFLIGICVSTYAQNPGETCYKAIPLGKNYKADIGGAKTVWYTAWTYDLPLSVYFIPKKETDPAPEVMMDFGCTPGIYGDPILCMLFCKGAMMSKEIPSYPKLDVDTVEGKFAYVLSMGEKYRDLLLKMGIDYNVQVFIKVTYYAGGHMEIAPNDMFSNCMDGVKFMHLGDTVWVKAQDKKRHVVVPYVQWKNENIVYQWTGTQPCRFIVTSNCKSDVLDDGSDGSILQIQTLNSGEETAVSKKDIKRYVDFVDNQAGMFFVKCYSEGDGVLSIIKEPVPPARGGAIMLNYDQEQLLMAKDTDALFAISQDFEDGTKFSVPTDHIFRMYVDSTPNYIPSKALFTYTFNRVDTGGHDLKLAKADMTKLWAKKNKNDRYLYIRFACTARTTILPTLWTPSECATSTTMIEKNSSITVPNPSYGVKFFRFRYTDWMDGDMIFRWTIRRQDCQIVFGDTCDYEMDDPVHVFYSMSAPKKSGSDTIPRAIAKEEIAKWRDRLDDDGFLYIRFFPGNNAGTMLINSNAPEEQDPTYPASTISMVCEGTKVIVNVSEIQNISVTDLSGTQMDQWSAEPGTPHELNLSPGAYILEGSKEKIAINL